MACSVMVVLPPDSGPKISTTRMRGVYQITSFVTNRHNSLFQQAPILIHRRTKSKYNPHRLHCVCTPQRPSETEKRDRAEGPPSALTYRHKYRSRGRISCPASLPPPSSSVAGKAGTSDRQSLRRELP